MSYPPPPPFRAVPQEQPTVAAWLIPVAGVLALLGTFTPWFKPVVSGTVGGVTRNAAVDDALYSWRDGRIGLIAPIMLVLLSIGVVGLLRGRRVNRFHSSSHGPVTAAGRAAMIAGAVSLVATGAAWLILPHQYKFDVRGTRYSWDDFIRLLGQDGAQHVQISHSPQIGYWLTIAAGLVALVAGALMVVVRRVPTSPAAGFKPPTGPPPHGYPPMPGFSAPGFQAPGFQAPPAAYPTAPADERMPVYQPPPAQPTAPADERMPVYEPPPVTQPPPAPPQFTNYGETPYRA